MYRCKPALHDLLSFDGHLPGAHAAGTGGQKFVILRNGRLQISTFARTVFLHEHPAEATYSKETSFVEVISLLGGRTSRFNQCCYGLTSPYEGQPIRQIKFLLHNLAAIDAEFGNRYCACCVRHRQIIGPIHGIPFEPLLPGVLPETLAGHGPSNIGSTPSGRGRIGSFRRLRPGGCTTWERPEAALPESLAE